MSYASFLHKSKYSPSKFVLIGIVVAVVVVGGFPLFLNRKTSAAGTRPVLENTWEQSSASSNTASISVSPAGSNNVMVAIASYRTLDQTTDSLSAVDLDGNDNFTFICHQTGEGYSIESWYIAGTVSGSYTANFTWNTQVDDIIISVNHFSGADTSSPISASACDYSSAGWSAYPSVGVNVPNSYSTLIGAATTYTGNFNTLAVDCSQAEIWNDSTSNVNSAGSFANDRGAGFTNFCWAGTNDWPWATTLVAVNGIDVSGPIRGTSGDLWADREVGRRDFGEISPGLVDAAHVYAPGGAAVYLNTGAAGYMYTWDSQNSRIVGLDLGTCYGDGSTNCLATMVIGQVSLDDRGGCNQDSSFGNYPTRIPSSASTLCGMSEWTHTVLEDKSFTQMYVDQTTGDLYVYDTMNNRVLKYNDPLSNDTAADSVWGQADMTGNECNRSGGYFNVAAGAPTDSSLCFTSAQGAGGGVTFDTDGNMWVADGGNNRVLRFPNTCGGPCGTADIVIGQTDFISHSYGSNSDQLQVPTSVSFDVDGRMYISDAGNNRVQTFDGPFSTGMSSSGSFGSYSGNVTEVDVDPTNTDRIYVTSNLGFSRYITKLDTSANVIASVSLLNPGGGSVGFDADFHVLATSYVYGQNVHRLYDDNGGNLVNDFDVFKGGSYNHDDTGARFDAAGWTGVQVIGSQLFAGEGRLLFWNNVSGVVNGQTPDGYLGGTGFNDYSRVYSQLKRDNSNRLWAIKDQGQVEVFTSPFNSGDTASNILLRDFDLIGGGSIVLSNVSGIAVSPDASYLWLASNVDNRVIRVRDPLTTPIVDVVLGQASQFFTSCNRGGSAQLNTLCSPSNLSLDNFGNLYVSDHYLEVEGNLRLLMFHASLFPDSPVATTFGPDATKQFDKSAFEVSFDSSNRMYAAYNPYYTTTRFVEYYNNPAAYNSSDPMDQSFATPSGHFNDFTSWVIGTAVDASDNLYAFDANRGRILIYDTPLTQDTTNPTVTITAPANNANVSGSLDLTSTASDDMSVIKVHYDLDGVTSLGGVYASPYTLNINAGDYSGTHTLNATVTDGAGHTASDSITLNFSSDSTPPTVSILAPADNANVSGTYNVTTDAADDFDIDHVDLYVDGNQVASVSNAPWNISWDTTSYFGTRTIYVIAYDTSSNSTQSASKTVHVLDGTPPTGQITAPGDGGHVTKNTKVTISANASDNGTLNRVDFYVNGIRKCAAVSVYNCSWTVPRAGGTFTIFARVIDQGGNTTDTDSITVTSP